MQPGPKELEALQKEITGRMLPGDDIVVLSPIGLMGTLELIREDAKIHERRGRSCLTDAFSPGFLKDACIRCEQNQIPGGAELPSGIFANDLADVHAYYALGEAGFLGGLWIMAEASGTGLDLDLRKVPILQYTIEICEKMGEHPYKISSRGSMILAITYGEAFALDMRRKGYYAEVCGRAERSIARLLRSGEGIRYLEKPPTALRPGRLEYEKDKHSAS